MVINFKNKILGQHINTRTMTIETPPEYIAKVVKLLDSTWNHGRKLFEVKEAEIMAGQVNHIAQTA